MGAELGKRLKDKVVILGRTSDDYFKDTRKLDFLMGRLSPQPSSEVIDLTTRKSGLDSLIEYNDMVRDLHDKGLDWVKERNDLARKVFRGKV
jgi:hypothetical protein